MFRLLLCPVLILQLTLPAPAVGEFVFAFLPTSAPAVHASEPSYEPTSSPAKPIKICPCTGKPGCNCCGCGDEVDGTDPDATCPTDSEANNSPGSESLKPVVRCSCKPAAGLAAAASYLPGKRLTAVTLCDPRPEFVPTFLASLADISLPIDHPPPKS